MDYLLQTRLLGDFFKVVVVVLREVTLIIKKDFATKNIFMTTEK